MIKNTIVQQFGIAWSLLDYHLQALDNEECLWQPGGKGLTVRRREQGWIADWPEKEDYAIGAPNIAWLTWHIIFWWSMTLDHCFSRATLTREAVLWPGNIQLAKKTIESLRTRWLEELSTMSDDQMLSAQRTNWPIQDKPFCELAAWLNLELMKNAAEIGFCRFLYASR